LWEDRNEEAVNTPMHALSHQRTLGGTERSLMPLRSILAILVLVASLIAATAAAAATGGHASLLIRHQVRGCHAWSVDGGAFKTTQTLKVRHGSVLVVTNNDIMPHTLVLTSGPKVRIARPRLGHMGASLALTLARPGTYHFTTKPGEDYPGMDGMKTIGEDNVLRVTVVVS
jgi:plastocyanin